MPTSADYTASSPDKTLHYELVGYKGTPQFLPGADLTGEVTGVKTFLLAQGDLISGHLDFTGGGFGGIVGDLRTTMQIHGKVAGELGLHVTHSGFAQGGDSQLLADTTTGALIGAALHGGNAIARFYPLQG